MKLIAELRRRKVFRAVVVYVAAAWFLLGVFNLAFESWSMPEHTLRYVWIAVLLGFPIAVVLVWRYDITDDGIVRTSPSSSDEQVDLRLQRSDYIILTVFISILGVIGYQLTTNIIGVEGDRQVDSEVREAPAGSIAVLPFEDISPGGDQAYLGNGIADELRLELQRLDGLRVAGRTSSIAYTQEDGKTLGGILNVASILEGSIRKDGNSIRITVHLTNVADGFTIWSESYNRELANIFELQEEIATSVAGALGVTLGVGEINAFRGAGTRNVEAYEAYLQGQNLNRNLTHQEAMRLIERAIELDPNYAAAWSLLGLRTLGTLWDASPDQTAEIIERAHALTLHGVQLNPESATAQARLGVVRNVQLDWIGGEQSMTRAIQLFADRPIVASYGGVLIRNGRTAYAQKQYAIAESLEPLGGRPVPLSWHASVAQGQFAEAKEISNWQDAANRIENNLDIAFNEGDPEELKAAIRAMSKTNLAYISLYAPVLTDFDSRERVLSMLRGVYSDENLQWPRKLHDIAMVAAYFGDPQFGLKVKGQDVHASTVRMAALWYPVMSEARQLPEFKTLVTDLNLVAYWRAYGWADACKPLGDNDFTCI